VKVVTLCVDGSEEVEVGAVGDVLDVSVRWLAGAGSVQLGC